jgi:hypothetical protein
MRMFPLSSAPRALNALLSPARRVTLYGPSASSISLHYAVQEQLRSYLNRPLLLYLRTGIAAITKIRFLPGEMSPAQDFTLRTIKSLPVSRCVEALL